LITGGVNFFQKCTHGLNIVTIEFGISKGVATDMSHILVPPQDELQPVLVLQKYIIYHLSESQGQAIVGSFGFA
jgi:hypothetical protein